jgi:polyphosphate kinase 2 (PPK2 family)
MSSIKEMLNEKRGKKESEIENELCAKEKEAYKKQFEEKQYERNRNNTKNIKKKVDQLKKELSLLVEENEAAGSWVSVLWVEILDILKSMKDGGIGGNIKNIHHAVLLSLFNRAHHHPYFQFTSNEAVNRYQYILNWVELS